MRLNVIKFKRILKNGCLALLFLIFEYLTLKVRRRPCMAYSNTV